MTPEKGATLKIYNYADYLSPQAIKAFEDQYGCKVEVSTFNDGDEAITKLRSGVDFDIYNANYTEMSRLVTGGLLRPLNHSYLQNISNVWPSFTNPWYDQGWQYTVPYTIYTTGMGWRSDQVPADIGALKNPYESLWDPAFKNKTAIIDDWHTAMAMVLLKQGITDVNTSSADDLKMVGEQLSALVKATSPKVTITMYSDMPSGQIGLCQMWSGDIINAQSYLPEGVGTDILQYWFPQDGKGLVDNDMLVTLKGGKNPVLAHLFLNHMLDPAVAKENFSAIGYQPPQNTITADSLIAEQFIPENLRSAIVKPEYFDTGFRTLELDAANDAAWHNVWNAFNAGGS
jgi:spermidine/putrescine transport system substrate-binding protein